jgi:hypothetical protein
MKDKWLSKHPSLQGLDLHKAYSAQFNPDDTAKSNQQEPVSPKAAVLKLRRALQSCPTSDGVLDKSDEQVIQRGKKRRKTTQSQISDIGHKHFLELLYKKFEQAERNKEIQARLGAIKAKYSLQSEGTMVSEKLRRVLSSDFNATSPTAMPQRVSSRDDIAQEVHKLLQPKKKVRTKYNRMMRPIKSKSLMPMMMQEAPIVPFVSPSVSSSKQALARLPENEVRNSAVVAVNKFRKERMESFELPHYSIKHSLSPTSPAARLVSLLCFEEASRLRRKGVATPKSYKSGKQQSVHFIQTGCELKASRRVFSSSASRVCATPN